jgi:hypothetical protein
MTPFPTHAPESSIAHTPGPWTITGISQSTGSISVGAKAQRIVIADVTNAASFGDFLSGAMKRGGGGFSQSDAKTQWANASLIAAAPDLLEALRFILAFYEPGQSYLDTEAWKVAEASARAAVTKAEGRS